MNIIIHLSSFIMPIIIIFIVTYGLYKKVNIYDEFIKGAKEGMKVTANIAPTLVGLMLAVSILRASKALDFFANILSPITNCFHFPSVLLPAVLIKLFSASAATGLVLDIFKEYGPDSYVGRLISIIMSSTETVFYIMSIYFMSISIKKTRYTLLGALLATVSGIIGSVIVTRFVF